MDLKEIEKLMRMLEKSELSRMAIRKKDFEIELEKEDSMASHSPPPVHHPTPNPASAAPAPSSAAPPAADSASYIPSPMVGTFYASPSPDDPAFVKVGDHVQEGQVVCIIEAMKVMNEVKADMSGKVAEILVKNGHPVEFGTKIFRIE